MSEFLMLMKGDGGTTEQWNIYIEKLIATGMFRGGSALANGQSIRAKIPALP